MLAFRSRLYYDTGTVGASRRGRFMKIISIRKTATLADSQTILNLLKSTPFFAIFSREDLRKLLHFIKTMREVAPGEIVFREGDAGDSMYFIASGTFEVIKTGQTSSRTMRLAVLTPGKTFGEMSLIDDYPRSATVRAINPAILLILTREQLRHLLGELPEIGIKIQRSLLQLLSQHLRKTSSNFTDFVDAVTAK